MAVSLRFDARSPFGGTLPLGKRNLGPWGQKKRIFISLIFSTLYLGFGPFFAKSQISNELAFERLIVKSISKTGPDFGSVTGFITAGLKASLELADSASTTLNIAEPKVTWKKIPEKKLIREISTMLTFIGEQQVGFDVRQTDTLQRKEFSTARKTKYSLLKGDRPGEFYRYVLPATGIGAGFAGIISLFYIRSKR